MNSITIIGVVASILTGISLMPQLIKIIKSKKAEDVSYLMMIILFCGCMLWVVYGFMKDDWIIISSNSFSVVVNAITVFFSIKYKQK